MTNKPKIIKKHTLEEIELREYEDRKKAEEYQSRHEISLLKILIEKRPEKAKELLKELQTEAA